MPLLIFSTEEIAVIGITVGVLVFFAVCGVWSWLYGQYPQTTVLQIDPTTFTHTGKVRWYKALANGQPITVNLFGKLIPEIEIYLWREREMLKLLFYGIIMCLTFMSGILAYLYQADPVEFLKNFERIKLIAHALSYPGWIEGLIGNFNFAPAWLLVILETLLPLWLLVAAFVAYGLKMYFAVERPLNQLIEELEERIVGYEKERQVYKAANEDQLAGIKRLRDEIGEVDEIPELEEYPS